VSGVPFVKNLVRISELEDLFHIPSIDLVRSGYPNEIRQQFASSPGK
jgi:hypothetical protein